VTAGAEFVAFTASSSSKYAPGLFPPFLTGEQARDRLCYQGHVGRLPQERVSAGEARRRLNVIITEVSRRVAEVLIFRPDAPSTG
jgi:hypothetical protein